MLPDEMEAEKNRKIIVAQADEIDVLKLNVRELEEQLRDARIRNAELIKQNFSVAKVVDKLKEQECFCGLADELVLATEDY